MKRHILIPTIFLISFGLAESAIALPAPDINCHFDSTNGGQSELLSPSTRRKADDQVLYLAMNLSREKPDYGSIRDDRPASEGGDSGFSGGGRGGGGGGGWGGGGKGGGGKGGSGKGGGGGGGGGW